MNTDQQIAELNAFINNWKPLIAIFEDVVVVLKGNKAATLALEDVKTEISSNVKMAVEPLNTEIGELTTSLEAETTAHNETKNALAEKETAIAVLEHDKEALVSENENLTLQVSEHEATIAELEKQVVKVETPIEAPAKETPM